VAYQVSRAHGRRGIVRSDEIGHWVGSPGGSMFDDPPSRGHRIRLGTIEDTSAIMAAIHLFADAGTPEYLVVVGQLHTPPHPPTAESTPVAVPGTPSTTQGRWGA
jgi:hypothetical protein